MDDQPQPLKNPTKGNLIATNLSGYCSIHGGLSGGAWDCKECQAVFEVTVMAQGVTTGAVAEEVLA